MLARLRELHQQTKQYSKCKDNGALVDDFSKTDSYWSLGPRYVAVTDIGHCRPNMIPLNTVLGGWMEYGRWPDGLRQFGWIGEQDAQLLTETSRQPSPI